MPIILPHGLTTPEIRVLQEYRRQNLESMPLDAIKAIKHPAGGGGEVPTAGLLEKGFLQTNGTPESFALTQKAKDFLAIDAKPEFEGAGSAEENIEVDAT